MHHARLWKLTTLILWSLPPLSMISPTPVALAAGSQPVVSLRPADSRGNQLSGPGYFTMSLRAGQSTRLFASVGNRGQRRGVIAILPVGARSGPDGGISFDLPSPHPHGVAAWVRVAASGVVADPGKAAVVPFTVRVPRDAKPGQYIGALTAFVPRSAERRRGVSLTVQTRVALAILVDVPGPRYAGFQVQDVGLERRPGSFWILAHIRNTGNTLLKGWGYLWIWQHGRQAPVMSAPLKLNLSVPQSTFRYPFYVPRALAKGTYTYAIKVWWNGGQRMKQGSFRVGT